MIGIDLGTTNCTLAFKGEKGIEQFPIPQQITADMVADKSVLPSFYCFPLVGEPFLGWYARERGAELPDRVIASAKSWLCHDAIDRRAPFLPLSDPKMSPIEVCTALLKHLRAAFPDEQSALVTVPASFDPSARQLVLEAAEAAGFGEVILLEEPLAAFYAWLHRHEEDWREILSVGDTVLVADIGGGTTDFSLISVEEKDGDLHLERQAVGDHLLLGGDNIDLSLAYLAQNKLGGEERPGLVHAVRKAKEALLGDNPPDSFDVTLEGRGSSVIGGSVTVALTRQEVEACLIDGFFPIVPLTESVQKETRSGIAKLGLPYARDPRITAQLARFLRESGSSLPSAVLFNGGTLKASAFQWRLVELLSQWRGEEVNVLPDPDYDFGVSRGAVYYGVTRDGEGIRVRAGTSRSYYIGVEGTAPAVPGVPPPIKPVCVVPMGMEEGTELTLADASQVSIVPSGMQMSVTVSSVIVSVPVLSVAMIVQEPRDSTAGICRTMTLTLDILHELHAVAFVARQHVQVEVEHRLSRRLAVRLVDRQPRRIERGAHGARHARRGAKHRRRLRVVERIHVLGVRLAGDQHVSRIHLPEIHESEGRLVLVHHARGNLLRHELAEHAIGRHASPGLR